jgi:glycosyltransferase involved in cell wall biosynthesis
MMSKLSLSVVIITLNEEENLSRCLTSVKDWAGEVVVVDSGSTDRTVQIAESLGAKVIFQEWLGFGAQKKFAVDCAKFDWVLSLDADEQCSPELIEWLRTEFKFLKQEQIYSFSRKSFYLGRWIRGGGWYPDYQARLFHRKYAQWNTDSIHEKVVPQPETQQLKIIVENFGARKSKSLKSVYVKIDRPILHFVFKNISHQVSTNNRYSSLQAAALLDRGVKFSWAKLLFKPISKFLECYLIKLGFLDGAVGFLIAYSAGYSAFLKWAKLWELQKRKGR